MRKAIQILGIAVLCLAGLVVLLLGLLILKNRADAQKPWLPEDYYTAFASQSPLEKKYMGRGSFAVSHTVIPSEDASIQNFRLWYPAGLETSSETYPLVLITNASNMAALNYEPFFERLASWGFIVAGNDDRQAGTGASTSQTLDFLLEQNETPGALLYGKIDRSNIGIAGYSQGGAGAVRAVTEYPNSGCYKALFTGSAPYPLLARNMGWEYDAAKISIPCFMTAGTGRSDDSGHYGEDEFSGVAPLFSLQDNYDAISDSVFKLRARVAGAEHEDMMRTDGYMTAWMLYHLQGDAEAASVFLGPGAEILTNSNWQDIEKNR